MSVNEDQKATLESDAPSGGYRHIVPGYHGTSSVRAARILSEGFELERGKECWFGTGAYFWENEPRLTRVHAKKSTQEDVASGDSTVDPAYLEAWIGLGDDWLDLTTRAGRSVYKNAVPKLIRKVPLLQERFEALHRERRADRAFLKILFGVLQEELNGVRAFTYVSSPHYELENPREVTMMRLPVQLRDDGPQLVSRALEGIGIQLVVKRNPASSSILNIKEHHGEL